MFDTVEAILVEGKSKFKSEDNIVLNFYHSHENNAGDRAAYDKATRFCIVGALPAVNFLDAMASRTWDQATKCLLKVSQDPKYNGKAFLSGGYSLAEIHAIYDKAIELAKAENVNIR